jgi:thioredoxin reductase (NADPH)
MNDKIYDLAIIGAGPAGISASIYASRYKLEHLLFGVEPGGQMSEIWKIENFPGFISAPGKDLLEKFIVHLDHLGTKIRYESVAEIFPKEDNNFEVVTGRGKYNVRGVILAMGAKYRKMNIPGERELTGKGVSYCATCDGVFFKDQVVAVVGGGNSAAVVSLEMAEFASKVYFIFRSEKPRAEPLWLDKINKEKKIISIKNTNVIEIKGESKVEKIILDNPFEDRTILQVDGVFIEVGTEPGIEIARKLKLELDQRNYIVVGKDQMTSLPGIYAAGDITNGSNGFRQVLTACAEGAIAADSVYRRLKIDKK